MAKKTIEFDGLHIKVNDQKFNTNNRLEATLADYGWTGEFLDNMLYVADIMPKHEWMRDPEILNNLGSDNLSYHYYMDSVHLYNLI